MNKIDIRGLTVYVSLSVAIYLSAFSEIQGVQNIAKVYVGVMTVLFVIASLAPYEQQDEKPVAITYTFRIWSLLIGLAMIYNGMIVTGIVWLLALLIVVGKATESDKKVK